MIGSYDGSLYGLDALTGKAAWTFKTEGQVHSSAAIVAGVAWIAGCDGHLRGIRVADGKQVAAVKTGSYAAASPAFGAGRAYFATYDNEVMALDPKSGRILWRYEHPQRKFPYISSAALFEGLVIVGGRDKILHALDAATGKEKWSYMTKARIEGSPVVAGGRVYIGGGDGRFYVFDARSGAKLQEWEAGSAFSASPAVANGKVVIGTLDGRVVCLAR